MTNRVINDSSNNDIRKLVKSFNIRKSGRLLPKIFSSLIQASSGLILTVKRNTLSRFYWGRNSFYKQVLHLVIVVLTVGVFISGLSTRLFGITSANGLQIYDSTLANVDVLSQGGGLETVLPSNPSLRFQSTDYVVKSGDSLQSIADQFNVSKQTIKDSNRYIFGNYDRYTNESVIPGDKLTIPEVNGVIYDIQSGDSLDAIAQKTSGDKAQIIGFNNLYSPDYSLAGISKILVPNGKLPAPPAPPPSYIYAERPPGVGVDTNGVGLNPLNGVFFSNPLSHPDCAGYVWMRGFIPGYHDGVDLAKGGGCPERAACDGVVTVAYWADYLSGNTVTVDCGNGVKTIYYHGSGTFYVRVGDHVTRGQEVQYMGCSGNCTGTHLHVTLKFNGEAIDPSPYLPY